MSATWEMWRRSPFYSSCTLMFPLKNHVANTQPAAFNCWHLKNITVYGPASDSTIKTRPIFRADFTFSLLSFLQDLITAHILLRCINFMITWSHDHMVILFQAMTRMKIICSLGLIFLLLHHVQNVQYLLLQLVIWHWLQKLVNLQGLLPEVLQVHVSVLFQSQ